MQPERFSVVGTAARISIAATFIFGSSELFVMSRRSQGCEWEQVRGKTFQDSVFICRDVEGNLELVSYGARNLAIYANEDQDLEQMLNDDRAPDRVLIYTENGGGFIEITEDVRSCSRTDDHSWLCEIDQKIALASD